MADSTRIEKGQPETNGRMTVHELLSTLEGLIYRATDEELRPIVEEHRDIFACLFGISAEGNDDESATEIITRLRETDFKAMRDLITALLALTLDDSGSGYRTEASLVMAEESKPEYKGKVLEIAALLEGGQEAHRKVALKMIRETNLSADELAYLVDEELPRRQTPPTQWDKDFAFAILRHKNVTNEIQKRVIDRDILITFINKIFLQGNEKFQGGENEVVVYWNQIGGGFDHVIDPLFGGGVVTGDFVKHVFEIMAELCPFSWENCPVAVEPRTNQVERHTIPTRLVVPNIDEAIARYFNTSKLPFACFATSYLRYSQAKKKRVDDRVVEMICDWFAMLPEIITPIRLYINGREGLIMSAKNKPEYYQLKSALVIDDLTSAFLAHRQISEEHVNIFFQIVSESNLNRELVANHPHAPDSYLKKYYENEERLRDPNLLSALATNPGLSDDGLSAIWPHLKWRQKIGILRRLNGAEHSPLLSLLGTNEKGPLSLLIKAKSLILRRSSSIKALGSSSADEGTDDESDE